MISLRLMRLSCALICLFNAALGQIDQTIDQTRALLAESKHQEVVSLLAFSVDADSSSPLLPYYLGLAYQGLPDHENAIAVFERAKQLDPASIPVVLALGRSYESIGLTQRSEEEYLHALSLEPTNRMVRLNLARMYAEAKRWDKAKALYERLAAEDISNVFVQIQMARSCAGIGLVDDAIVYYERAFRKNPRKGTVALELINVYLATERLISARRVADRGLEVHPENAALIRRRGDIAFREGMYVQAVTMYQRAIDHGDSSASVWKMLGTAQHFSGNSAGAEISLQRSFGIDTTDASTPFYLGVVKRNLNKLDESLALLHRVVGLLTTGLLPDAYTQLAVTSEAGNDAKHAIRYYRKALELNPAKSDLLFHLATVYDKHYADQSVASLYYRKFLSTSQEESTLTEYAAKRLGSLKERLHFQSANLRK